ncbi:MAG: hypothetical protein D6808_07800, partial [Candidatus Dadabacteria bacterium]
YKLQGATTYTQLNTDTTSPYTLQWGGVLLTRGESYHIKGTASDGANHQSSATSLITVFDAVPQTSSILAPSSGTSGSINLAMNTTSCTPSVSTSASWISASFSSGQLVYTVSPNTTTAQRTGTITVEGHVISVSQEGSSQSGDNSGGTDGSGGSGNTTYYNLTVLLAPSTGGTVRINNSDICADPPCSYRLSSGTVNLEALPQEGYTFAGWGGDAQNCGGTTCNLTLSSVFTTVAVFKKQSAGGSNGKHHQKQKDATKVLKIESSTDTLFSVKKGSGLGYNYYSLPKKRKGALLITASTRPALTVSCNSATKRFKAKKQGKRKSRKWKFLLKKLLKFMKQNVFCTVTIN